jgi:RHS repeat-associated protein
VFFDDLIITHTKGKVLQEDHYYPFGLNISALSSTAPLSKPNQFKIQGKEQQTEFDINLYDFGARNYDPQIGRWLNPDPLADQFYNLTPYNYVENNPLRFIDPDGMLSTEVEENEDGTYKVVGGNLDDRDKSIYVVDADGNRVLDESGNDVTIGTSVSIDSFYNYDGGEGEGGAGWYGTIDASSTEGGDWLKSNIFSETPTLAEYVLNRDDYDYKDLAKGDRSGIAEINYRYRGSQVSKGVFGSARDVGNIAAGYVAGNGGVPYSTTRWVFDALQSSQNTSLAGGVVRKVFGNGRTDAPNSQAAQVVGWGIGNSRYKNRVDSYWRKK